MSDQTANPEPPAAADFSPVSGFAGLPRWLRIGLVAAATAVVALIIAVIIRIVLQTPVIPLGETAAEDLHPGSCLAEPGVAQTYTVVNCSTPHQQQVIASIDLEFPGVPYSADDSLATFAQLTCERLLEYRLFLPSDLKKSDYAMLAIAPPTLEEYQAGDSETLCAVLDNPEAPEAGGTSDDLTVDLYRQIPRG